MFSAKEELFYCFFKQICIFKGHGQQDMIMPWRLGPLVGQWNVL